MRTLEKHISRKYSDFDLSNDIFLTGSFSKYDWRYFVPPEITDIWNLLAEDEKFLIALTAEAAID